MPPRRRPGGICAFLEKRKPEWKVAEALEPLNATPGTRPIAGSLLSRTKDGLPVYCNNARQHAELCRDETGIWYEGLDDDDTTTQP